MPIRNIHHVSCVVPDTESALRFWHESVGLPVVEEKEFEGDRSTLLSFGNTFLELLQPGSAPGDRRGFLERTGGGLYHIAFEVEDAAAELEAMKGRGVPLRDAKLRTLSTGRGFTVAREAAQSVLVEIVQPDHPTHLQGREDALFYRVVIVATLTNDLFASARQWEQTFGLQVYAYLRAPEADNRHLMVTVGPPGSVPIEIITPLSETGKNAAYLRKAGDTLFQLGVRAEDPDDAGRRLEAAGYRIQREAGMDQGRNATFVHPKSTDNVFVAVFPPGPIPSGPVGDVP